MTSPPSAQFLPKIYNEARTHLSLHKDAPIPRAVQTVGRTLAVVLGGLHHQYLERKFPTGTRDAAEITDARELPVQTDGAHEGCARDLVTMDVVDFEPPLLILRSIMSVSPWPLKSPKPIRSAIEPDAFSTP